MAYLKPQSPIKIREDHIYPLTTADQVILSDGTRLEQNGEVVADRLSQAISLTGDVIGTTNYDRNNGITINTAVSASKYFNVTFKSSDWSVSAPYTQTVNVNGIKASDNPIVDVNMASVTTGNSSDLLSAWGLVGRVATANDSVTAYCYEEKPAVDITVNIMVVK